MKGQALNNDELATVKKKFADNPLMYNCPQCKTEPDLSRIEEIPMTKIEFIGRQEERVLIFTCGRCKLIRFFSAGLLE